MKIPIRAAAIASALVTLSTGVVFVACSDGAEGPGLGQPEAGTNEAGNEGGGRPDASTGLDGGNCSAVKGDCDIVLQNCGDGPAGQKRECVVNRSADAFSTTCVDVQGSQNLPRGRSCCPNSPGGNPCLPGLACIGDDCIDGGPVLGRCSPACCEGDNAACGASEPEGIAGTCDITLFSSNVELHHVCSYRERCKPFRQERCQAGQTCLVEDKLGTAGCINSTNLALGAPCTFGNDCADGLFCLNIGDGGLCRMACLTPGSVHPFDAGVEDGGPFFGGCNPGQLCDIGPFLDDLPPWLSFCRINGQ